MDYTRIMRFVEENYPDVSSPDRDELVAEAVVFLAGLGLEVLDPSIHQTLSDHLAEYRDIQKRERSGKITSSNWHERLLTELPEPFEKPISDDEKISYIAIEKLVGQQSLESEELERDIVSYERRRDEWRALLPLIESEALELLTSNEKTHTWTAGLGPAGLRILLQRARIRMKWKDYE